LAEGHVISNKLVCLHSGLLT